MAPLNPTNVWGNEKTMNLNTLILSNIQASPYFKVQLFELKTFHEVVDEIFYKVEHLEPWEKGSRKTAGQTGMCGGVRGVGAGGIVSSAYCLLYKMFTLKLTKKQLNNLLNHCDSPYIRGLGFMYIRYTQNPADLWAWYEPYLDDEEELDVKAGGGHTMTIGEMLKQWLIKLEWYSTLFPRIPVPVQKDIDSKMRERAAAMRGVEADERQNGRQNGREERGYGRGSNHGDDEPVSFGEAERQSKSGGDRERDRDSRRSPPPRRRSRSPRRERQRDDFSRELERERDRQRRDRDRPDRDRRRSRSPDTRRSRSQERRRSRSRERRRSRSPIRRRSRSPEKKRSRSKERRRSRERSRERSDKPKHRSRSREKHREHKKKHKKDKDRDRERKREKN